MRQKNSNNNGDNISNSVSVLNDSTEVFPFRLLKTKTNWPVSTEARIWQVERKIERTSKKWQNPMPLMYFYRFRAMRGNGRATRMHSPVRHRRARIVRENARCLHIFGTRIMTAVLFSRFSCASHITKHTRTNDEWDRQRQPTNVTNVCFFAEWAHQKAPNALHLLCGPSPSHRRFSEMRVRPILHWVCAANETAAVSKCWPHARCTLDTSSERPNDRRRRRQRQFNQINALMDGYTLHKSLMPPFIAATADDGDAYAAHTTPRWQSQESSAWDRIRSNRIHCVLQSKHGVARIECILLSRARGSGCCCCVPYMLLSVDQKLCLRMVGFVIACPNISFHTKNRKEFQISIQRSGWFFFECLRLRN